MNATAPGILGFLLLAMGMTASLSSPLCADGPANSERQAELEIAITGLLREHGVPGASIAVINDYRILWAEGYGVTSPSEAAPVTETTRFQACSLSKPVVVQALLTLVVFPGRTMSRSPASTAAPRRS